MDVAHDRWTRNTLVADTRSGTGKQERIVRSLFLLKYASIFHTALSNFIHSYPIDTSYLFF